MVQRRLLAPRGADFGRNPTTCVGGTERSRNMWGSALSYQCDTVFKGSLQLQGGAKGRFGDFFNGELNPPGTIKVEPALKNPLSSERRIFGGIDVKLALDELPPAMRHVPCPPRRALRVIPLWDGLGDSFAFSLVFSQEGHQTEDIVICKAESRATLDRLLSGWSDRTADHQLGF